jgi:hypothetical protein
MVTKPIWVGLRAALTFLLWLASIAGATHADILRVLLSALPIFENPWVWVTGLTASTAIVTVEATTWLMRRNIERVELSVHRGPMLFEDPDKRSMRQWVHAITITNTGTQDVDANCLVRLVAAHTEVGHTLAWLPFVLRPVNQVREDRYQPFNLRRGEEKAIAIGFSLTLAGERNWVDFVNGRDVHRVTFEPSLTRWLVVRIAAFGGGPPCYSTGVFILRDRQLSFRPRRGYEVVTKSLVVANIRWLYRRYGRPAARRARERLNIVWPRYKAAALTASQSLARGLGHLRQRN